MKPHVILLFSILTLVGGCKVSPEDIQYNQDECAHCKMQISDNRFGAELVTVKGKVYKYDSAECLFRALSEGDKTEYEFILVTDFTEPETLIDARTASFLVSPKRQSPMGGNLSAYRSENLAQTAMTELGGEVHSFNEMAAKYKSGK